MSKKSIISGWQGSLILMVCAGMLITSCAGRKHEIVKFNPVQKESFSARKQVPQISQRTKEELIQRGYIKLGNLNVEHTVKECWDDSSKCDPVSQSKDPTTVLLNKAADKGADVVLLSADKKSGEKSISKEGECLQWEEQCVYVQVPTYETVCDYKSITCSQRVTGARSELRCNDYCVSYQTISGKASLVKSSGTLWRHEPDRAKKGQQQLAFITAVKENNLQKIKEMPAAGNNVNFQDSKGNTALHYAIEKADQKMVLLLLDKGAKMDLNNKDNKTALGKAIKDGNKEIVSLLLDKNPKDKNYRNIHLPRGLKLTITLNNKEMVRLFLDKGADVNYAPPKDFHPIAIAILFGDKEMVSLLLNRGANINVRGPFIGDTPLHKAVEHRKTEIISLLLERGADIKAKDKKWNTPLHVAAEYGTAEIITLLLERGADINAQDVYENTPLHEAVLRGRTDSVRILLDKGANLNIQNDKGYSPLWFSNHCPPSGPASFAHCKKCDKKAICRKMGELLRAKGVR